MNIRFAIPSDAKACNDFYNAQYNKNRPLDVWHWEFLSNRFNHTIPYALAEHDGKVIGTQALIPIRFVDDGGVFWTAKSEETLVDADFRGKNIFNQMYALLFEFAAKHDIQAIWGFTQAKGAFLKAGFDIPASTAQNFRPLRPSSAPRLLFSGGVEQPRKTALRRAAYWSAGAVGVIWSELQSNVSDVFAKPPEGSLEVRTLLKPPAEAGELCLEFQRQWGGLTIYRDAKYLQWRIFDNPIVKPIVIGVYHMDELVGWTAFGLANDGLGYLVDVVAIGHKNSENSAFEIVRLLLKEATSRMRDMGALGVRGWSVTDHPFDRLVRKAAKGLGYYYLPRGHSVVVNTKFLHASRASLRNFQDWYVSRIYTEGHLG